VSGSDLRVVAFFYTFGWRRLSGKYSAKAINIRMN